MLNQSLLNDSSIVNDDVDFPVSSLEPLREEEEEGGVDVEDDGTRNQTTSVIPSMANLVEEDEKNDEEGDKDIVCLLYTSPSPRDRQKSRMPSSA